MTPPINDHRLGRYQPLEHVLTYDDFDEGFHGWHAYFADYDGWVDYPGRYPPVSPVTEMVARERSGDDVRFDRRFRIGKRGLPMRSSLSYWDGTCGLMSGTYALKIPTLPEKYDRTFAQKRMTSPWRGKFRIETYFCLKTDPRDFELGERDIRSMIVSFDVMDRPPDENVRWWPSIRYHNAENGEFVRTWQVITTGSKGVKDGPWTDLADGYQDLGYNRAPTKYQWHYLRVTFDLAEHVFVDLNCYGKEFKVAGIKNVPEPRFEGWRGSTDKCQGLVNIGFGVEAGADKRCFLYLDSVLISAAES